MVSIKKKSKRQHVRDRHKIAKKIANHHRKTRKQARKNGNVQWKSRYPSDPGVPRLFPYKEQFLDEIVLQRQEQETAQDPDNQDQDHLDQDKESGSGSEINESEWSGLESSDDEDSNFVVEVDSKLSTVENIELLIPQVDAVFIVLDGRIVDCYKSFLSNFIDFAKTIDNKLAISIILTCTEDLPSEDVELRINALNHIFPTFAFSSEFPCKSSISNDFTIAVIGPSKSGKSTLINKLRQRWGKPMKAKIEHTLGFDVLKLSKTISVIDTPSLTYTPKLEISSNSFKWLLCNKVAGSKISDPVPLAKKIFEDACKNKIIFTSFQQKYDLPFMWPVDLSSAYDYAQEFLISAARALNRLNRNGYPNIESSAKAIIDDVHFRRVTYWTHIDNDSMYKDLSTKKLKFKDAVLAYRGL